MTRVTETEFQAEFNRYFDAAIGGKKIAVTCKRGTAVLVPADEYFSSKETAYLMSSEAMENVILKGITDSRNGNFKVIDMEKL